MPRFGAFFVLKGTAFRCFILEPVPDVPLLRLWGSIGTRIPIWEGYKTYKLTAEKALDNAMVLIEIFDFQITKEEDFVNERFC